MSKGGVIAILNFQENRGFKLSVLGSIAVTIIKIGGYYAGIPDTVTSSLAYIVAGIFGTGVVTRSVTDAVTKGATSTINSDTAVAKIQAKAEVDVAKIRSEGVNQ